MSDTNNHSKNIIHRILTEQINLTSNELDTKSTKEIVNIFSEADKEPQKAVERVIPELINAISLLHQDGFKCRLTMYTALYDDESSLIFSKQLLSLICDLKLNKYIKLNTSFSTNKETLINLSSTDLVIFPYQSTNESVSGAVRQGITSLAPVAVTPLPIFDDVRDVVYSFTKQI